MIYLPPVTQTRWTPFSALGPQFRPEPVRSLRTPDGIADRLRSAAFAELQAREAFAWAAGRFEDAPGGLREAWLGLSREEDKHLGWLLGRLRDLKSSPESRKVSTRLWNSLTACATAREFAFFMAEAEERGRQAGLLFERALAEEDSLTSEIFGKIASEEEAHIALARRFF